MGWGAGGSCTPRPPIRPQPAPETRVITVVFLGLLLDLLAFTLLLPLLPGLLESHARAHVSHLPSPPNPTLHSHCSKPLRDSPAGPTSLSPRTPSMTRGSEGWTGLRRPLGCQQRRGTTASCSEVRCCRWAGPPRPDFLAGPLLSPRVAGPSPPLCIVCSLSACPLATGAISTQVLGPGIAGPDTIRPLGMGQRGDCDLCLLQV